MLQIEVIQYCCINNSPETIVILVLRAVSRPKIAILDLVSVLHFWSWSSLEVSSSQF